MPKNDKIPLEGEILLNEEGKGSGVGCSGRPRGCRRLGLDPKVFFYKPQGVKMNSLKVIELTHEEWEALRLKHTEGLDQIESAKEMGTSQSTLQRILSSAHKKIGQGIVQGLAIKIVKT